MKFNAEQFEIIKHKTGPLAVMANPGTGKTATICSRTIELIKKGDCKDYQILLITFTNKAKNEMKERLEKALGKNGVRVYTFHGFGAVLLREFGTLIDIKKNYTIIDESETISWLKKELNVANSKITPKQVIFYFQDSQNYDKDFYKYLDDKGADFETKEFLDPLHKKYTEWKRALNTVDLGDLQTLALKLIREKIQKQIEKKYRFMMVDEFQDTNQIQLELVKEICQNHKNIIIVGDMRQGIYSWRGAEPKNIGNFVEYFDSKVINLNKNYRSCKSIIATYNKLIDKSHHNFGAPTAATKSKSGLVKYFTFEDDIIEAEAIYKFIEELQRKVGLRLGEIAILYRTNALSRSFEDLFRRNQVPYQLIGSKSFYDRREVKDFLSFFKWMYNPADVAAAVRFATMTKCGVGQKTIENVYTEHFASKDRITFDDFNKVLGLLRPKAESFFSYLVSLSKKKLVTIAEDFLNKYKVISRLKEQDRKKNETRADNVISLLNLLKQNPNWSLQEFLDSFCLEKPKDDPDDDDNKISLLTIHKSKGLEFRAVFLIGFDEGILPHSMSIEEGNIEEERRAAYVAFSRAEEFLVITSSRFRTLAYNRSYTTSRFFQDIELET